MRLERFQRLRIVWRGCQRERRGAGAAIDGGVALERVGRSAGAFSGARRLVGRARGVPHRRVPGCRDPQRAHAPRLTPAARGASSPGATRAPCGSTPSAAPTSAYVQKLGSTLAPLCVKEHLAALKHWFDWLVTRHVLEVNPAHAVRGSRYSQSTGDAGRREGRKPRRCSTPSTPSSRRCGAPKRKRRRSPCPCRLPRRTSHACGGTGGTQSASSRCATRR